MEIKGIGTLIKREDYWEIEPMNLNGATIYIEKEHVTDEDVETIKRISASWLETLKVCYGYIGQNRESYGLEAKTFSNPNMFLNSRLEWAVYFDTESGLEAVVGVEFLGNKPNQLVIGD
ncbi:hypothetical protein NB535_14580 [Vibrio parahaemolyticus]|uniref:hypothetical protein n=1 Tax=Vibrio parahaemolyticus TaxID=670 RepID=UPI000A9AC0F4|nr:hypothetical protein [Vibrio parahaemolyticus]MCS0006142.1 hypothetical protein [Vibrio parahaemolyticus]